MNHQIRIRSAATEDIAVVMRVFDQARAAIAELGIDQWQDGYPTEAHIADDIEKAYGYVLCADGRVQGYFAMIPDGEPTYDRIYDGAWLTEGTYMTVHRVAMSDTMRGRGGTAEAMKYAVSRALRASLGSVRIDTHHGNVRMRKFLEKQGFMPCGTILLASGAERVAYELDLHPIIRKAPVILYEDRNILICEKPVGQPSQPDPAHADGSDLLSCIAAWRDACGYSPEIYLVHRLDTATGGAILYAKDKQSAARLGGMVVGKQIHKQYLAVVQGTLSEPCGSMVDYLYHDKAKNKAFVVTSPRKGVKEARLTYRVLAQREEISLLEVTLETGRTHQIRAQLSHAGHPLLGDGKYGSREKGCTTALWATRLCVTHPQTGKEVEVQSTPPRGYPWNLFD